MPKKISLIVILMQVFFTNAAFTQDQNSSEEEAVKTVIMNETKSWADRSYEGMINPWAHEKYVLSMFPGPYDYYETLSWDSIAVSISNDLKNYSTPVDVDFTWSDWNIRTFKDCAWASYIQKYTFQEKPFESREVRFLEKKDGLWKIVYLTAVYKSNYKESRENAEYNLNSAGYVLLEQNKIEDAIDIFKKNVKLYPESSSVYDSLGEAYMKNGDKELATQNYKKSLELDPMNENAKEMLNKLGGN